MGLLLVYVVFDLVGSGFYCLLCYVVFGRFAVLYCLVFRCGFCLGVLEPGVWCFWYCILVVVGVCFW